jgi:hypothetical protein
MTTLLYANLIPIAASLLIGIATARWAFRRPPSGSDRP